MLKKTSVKVILNNPKARFGGGDAISGHVVIDVPENKTMVLQELQINIVCDVKISLGDDRTIQNDRSRSDDYRNKIRYFTDEYSLASATVLQSGQYTYPFSLELRTSAPPSCEDDINSLFYGAVIHGVEAIALGTAAKSKLSKDKLTDRVNFDYVPLQKLADFDNNESHLSSYMSKSHFKTKESNRFKGFVKTLKDIVNEREDPTQAIQCMLQTPSEGFRQDKGNEIKVKFVPADSSYTLHLKDFKMSIENTMILKSGHSRRESKLFFTRLLTKTPTITGNEIDLSHLLTDLRSNHFLIPSFVTFKLSRKTMLKIEATITRESPAGTQVATFCSDFPLKVLSPVVMQDPEAFYSDSPEYEPLLNENGYPIEKKSDNLGYEEEDYESLYDYSPPVNPLTGENNPAIAPPSYI